jgi:5-methylcytosine-specific restriction endonuclease McrA
VKRGGPLRRTTPLRQTVKLARSTPLRAGRPKQRAPIPPEVAAAVIHRDKGCIVCGTGRSLQPHHVLPVERWPELTTHPHNIVLICWADHDNHTRAHRRIKLEELPPEAVRLAQETSGAAAAYLWRTYARCG